MKPIDGRDALSSSFSISPQIRSAGRSSSGIDRHSSRVWSSSVSSNLAANWIARSTRRLSSPNVVRSTTRRIRRARSPRPSKGSSYSPVSGSHEMALMVKSRRRAASSIDIDGSPRTSNPLWPASALRFAAGERHVDVADGLVGHSQFVDRKAGTDGFHATELRRAATADRSSAMPKTSKSMSKRSWLWALGSRLWALGSRLWVCCCARSESRTKPPTTSARPPASRTAEARSRTIPGAVVPFTRRLSRV